MAAATVRQCLAASAPLCPSWRVLRMGELVHVCCVMTLRCCAAFVYGFITLHCRQEGGPKPLSFAAMKQMWTDMISTSPLKTALGQPVLLSPEVTVLRIALGAQMVVEALAPETPAEREEAEAEMRAQDEAVLLKLKGLCARHWEAGSMQ